MGLGLTADTLWGLCHREYRAIMRQWERATERENRALATIRADLHNTSAKEYDRQFTVDDFMGNGKFPGVEKRVEELVAKGHDRATAVAMVMSKQSRSQKLIVLDDMERKSHKRRA